MLAVLTRPNAGRWVADMDDAIESIMASWGRTTLAGRLAAAARSETGIVFDRLMVDDLVLAMALCAVGSRKAEAIRHQFGLPDDGAECDWISKTLVELLEQASTASAGMAFEALHEDGRTDALILMAATPESIERLRSFVVIPEMN